MASWNDDWSFVSSNGDVFDWMSTAQGGRGAKIEKSRVTSRALQFAASEKEGYAQPS